MSVCRPQVSSFSADEKNSVRTWVQTDLGLQVCAGVCARVHMTSRGTFAPHLREEGPLSKTVYLPTCHVFAKTMILKDMSPSSVGPGHGAAFRVGWPCQPPCSWGLRSVRPRDAFAFLLCSQILKNC